MKLNEIDKIYSNEATRFLQDPVRVTRPGLRVSMRSWRPSRRRAYFTQLEEELQDDIIKRTEHGLP